MIIKAVSVYCGSSYPKSENAPVLIEAIKSLGFMLGQHNVLVRYGGVGGFTDI